jgi:hypothetical protein
MGCRVGTGARGPFVAEDLAPGGERLVRGDDQAGALVVGRDEAEQVFEAFCLQITYDKPNRRIEISATIAEAIADALETAGDLPGEVSSVAQRDIAGAGFEPATFGL